MAVWLITGCSTGLGRALAERVLAAGHQVVATARNPQALDELVASSPERVLVHSLDVTRAEDIPAVIEAAITRFGRVDVLVNNAGYGYRAAVEEGDDADVRELVETHFFGSVNLIKAVLPGMRERRSGAIVNITSIGVRLTYAGSGYYAAVKAALEALTGALRKELQPLGVTAMAVEPGAFRTDFSGRSLTESSVEIDDYAQTAGLRRKRHSSAGSQPGDPSKAADAIIAAVESGRAPEVLVLGSDAVEHYERILRAQLAELDQWRDVGNATDFDGSATA